MLMRQKLGGWGMSFDSCFELVPLKDVTNFVNGDRSTNYPKANDYISDGIPFISAADLGDGRIQNGGVKRITQTAYDRLRSGKISVKDILFCLRGSIGKIAFVRAGETGAIASSLVIVRAGERVDPHYLYFLLGSPAGQQAAMSLNNGSAQPNLSVGQLQQVRVPLPALELQRSIAEILRSLDDRITLLRETNATLEAVAQALFKSWFVDFDPVRAKMEGRAPEGIHESTAALFPDALEESDLGWVPKGWRMSHLADLTSAHHGSIQTGPFGSQLHASDYVDFGVPVVMPKDIKERRVMTDSVARVAQKDADRLSRHKLMAGDIVFSRRGDVERHALIAEREAGWLCGTGCLLLRPGKSWRSSTFLSMALDAVQARTWLVQHAVGATMPNINTGILGSVPVLLPPDALLSAFEDVVSATELQRSYNSSAAETLATLRDTLLPRLISGQLRLPEAQALVAAA